MDWILIYDKFSNFTGFDHHQLKVPIWTISGTSTQLIFDRTDSIDSSCLRKINILIITESKIILAVRRHDILWTSEIAITDIEDLLTSTTSTKTKSIAWVHIEIIEVEEITTVNCILIVANRSRQWIATVAIKRCQHMSHSINGEPNFLIIIETVTSRVHLNIRKCLTERSFQHKVTLQHVVLSRLHIFWCSLGYSNVPSLTDMLQ